MRLANHRTSLFLFPLIFIAFIEKGGAQRQVLSTTKASTIWETTAVTFTTDADSTPASNSMGNRNDTTQPLIDTPLSKTENKALTLEDCENLARDYVYKNNLCGAPDPDTYTEAARGRLSCEHRCGEAPALGRLWSECGCDELCVVFSYCCWDMAIQCPHQYWKGHELVLYAREKQMSTFCFADTLAFEPIYRGSIDDITITVDSLSSSRYTLTSMAVTPDGKPKSFNEVTISPFVGNLNGYIVADLSREIYFSNYQYFISLSGPNSNPNFVPIGTVLECPRMPQPRVKQVSLFQLFLWCDRTVRWRLQTSLDRDCGKNMFIGCGCGKGIFINSFYHDLCLAPNATHQYKAETALGLKMDDEVNMQLTLDNRCDQFSTYEKFFTFDELHSAFQDVEFHITTTPVIQTTSWTIFSSSSSIKDESEKNITEEMDPARGFQDSFHALNLVIESTQTLETRLVCPDHDSLLSKCHLAQCAPGTVLSTRLMSQWKFRGRSCEALRYAVVRSLQYKLSVCVCMRVLAALQSLQLWTPRLRKSMEIECVIELDLLSIQESTKLKTFYTFPDNPSQLITEPASLNDMKDPLQNSFSKTVAVCDSGLNTEDITVCFYTSVEEMYTARNAIGCLDLGKGSGREKLSCYPEFVVAMLLITLLSN